MKTYTIIAGVNGVGKSSVIGARIKCVEDYGVVIDADKLTAEAGSKIKGGKLAIEKINFCLDNSLSFTQETTLSGKRILRTIAMARERGYAVRMLYIAVSSAEESLSRIANRVRKGGHDIPAEDVLRRFNKRMDDLMSVVHLCDSVEFIDNENGFITVAEYKNGILTTFGENQPLWIEELKRMI